MADDGKDDEKSTDTAVAKTAGFVVFSGIAMSIIKALNPYNKPISDPIADPPLPQPLQHNTQPIIKEQIACVAESSEKTIEIVRGDTLWALSRKYGVSIEAIKEANGIKGDTIYAGKKLIIP